MCDRFSWKFDVQTSYIVNIKFPRATDHTIVPSTEELYCLKRNYLGMQTTLILGFILKALMHYDTTLNFLIWGKAAIVKRFKS